jgi:hypothetical protein
MGVVTVLAARDVVSQGAYALGIAGLLALAGLVPPQRAIRG